MGNAFALSRAAVHWGWVTAHLYAKQISLGVIAVTQACCEPVLQSSTKQWGLHSALSRAAVLWCWVTAYLYEQQITTGVIAVKQACSAKQAYSSLVSLQFHL